MKAERIEHIRKLRGKIITQLVLQSVMIIVAAVGSLFLMTWIVADALGVSHTYAAAGYETIGILVIMVLILSPWNVVLYRRRTRELTTLADAIKKVAEGDYSVRIPTKRSNAITPVYAGFNKMCAELESVRVLRNDFINSYSHEFKTPIASVNGFAQLLLERDLPEAERKQYLQIIVDESARLSSLSSNTILLSKLSATQIVSGVQKYNLGEQIRQCCVLLSQKWLDKGIDFTAELPDAEFSGNPDMLKHLWINLIDNAVKYTPEGGEVRVSLESNGEMVTVKVSDTGEGMTYEVKRHLFDPYYQGDSSHSRQGLGLGLSIAHRIVQLCHGRISVESEPDKGSCFTVTLPVNQR